MKASTARNPRTSSFILTNQDEIMVRSIYQFRYMTAEDMAKLHFSPKSVAYVRRLLTRLAGGADLQPNSYLVRFNLPRVSPGNQHKIFAPGIKAAKFMQREAGVEADRHIRLNQYKDLGFSHLRHALVLTRLVVCAHYWARQQTHYALTQTRMGYEIGRSSATAIPDAWLLFEDSKGKKYPIMIEIDRGMEFQAKFKRHVINRIKMVNSDDYYNTYGTRACVIAYATTGQTPDYREKRVATMMAWTREVLEELGKQTWAGIFRYSSLVLEKMYDQALFEKPVWHRIDSASPVPLLTP
jgi:Replication-relaxation